MRIWSGASVGDRNRLEPGATICAMLQTHSVDELQTRLGYRFDDPTLLEMSLTHRSWANEQGVGEHYERIEFLGDAVLGLLVAHWLYERFPAMAEGDLSKLKSYAVSETMLADWAESLELGDALRLGVGEDRSGGRAKQSLLADAMESVLGAVYLDGGMTAVGAVTGPWLEAVLANEPGELPVADAKTTLQELAQGRGEELPVYRHIAEEGPDHRKRFHVECWVGGTCLGVGTGPSKKQAEQSAAKAALIELEDR